MPICIAALHGNYAIATLICGFLIGGNAGMIYGLSGLLVPIAYIMPYWMKRENPTEYGEYGLGLILGSFGLAKCIAGIF